MKKLVYILIADCMLLVSYCYSQPSITWSKTYGQPFLLDLSQTVCNTGSGYYYVGGYEVSNGGYLLKINEYGDTAWTKFIPQIIFINTAITIQDKGCIIAGDSDSLTIIRLDSNSNVLWSRNYLQNFLVTSIKEIKRTLDGKYIACGYRPHELDGIMVKFDENGNLFWIKYYPANYLKLFVSLEIAPDNGYVVTGEVNNYDTMKTLLLRLDSAGNVIWEKQYKIFNRPGYGGFIKKTSSSYFIAGGTFDSLSTSSKRLFFMRVDAVGNLIYTKVIPFHKSDEFYAAQYITENRFIFSSFTFIQANYDTASYSKVIITDSLGNIMTSKNFYGNYYYGFNAITKANNSDIILTGSAKTPGSGEDILVCRVDSLLQGPPIGIKKILTEIPFSFNLFQNYPNPFNPSTKIKFDTPPQPSPKGREPMVRLIVYDVLGREVAVLVNQELKPGTFEVEFDGSNYPSGVYFYRLVTEGYTETRKMVLIK